MATTYTRYMYDNTSTATPFGDPGTYTSYRATRADELEIQIHNLEYRMSMMQDEHRQAIEELNRKFDKAIEILKSQGINITELI